MEKDLYFKCPVCGKKVLKRKGIKKLIEKACKWLETQLNDNIAYEAIGLYGDKVIISEEGLENFKKYLEE